MNKLEISKNRLDLSYRRNLQLLNIILLIGSGSFITYLVALILDFSKLLQYTFILALLGIITFILYKKIDKNLKNISERIDKLIR